MSQRWQVQDADARFGELVRRAAVEGPQFLSQQGVDTAVVLSIDSYHRLQAAQSSLTEHLFAPPYLDDDVIALINDRSGDLDREVDP